MDNAEAAENWKALCDISATKNYEPPRFEINDRGQLVLIVGEKIFCDTEGRGVVALLERTVAFFNKFVAEGTDTCALLADIARIGEGYRANDDGLLGAALIKISLLFLELKKKGVL